MLNYSYIKEVTLNRMISNYGLNNQAQPIAIITGGTGGIGLCLSEGYHTLGYKVIALDHVLHAPLSEGIDFHIVDISDVSAIKNVFELIELTYGKAEVLINNAAIANFRKPFGDVSENEWDHVMSVNLKGCFFSSQAFVPLAKRASYGRIINIASTRYHQNEHHHDVYGSSKGGMVALTQSLCVSLANTGITVNTISPGWIQTQNYEALTQQDHDQHPSGRVGRPDDILRACLFLSDSANDFINGANLIIDGGMTKRMIYF